MGSNRDLPRIADGEGPDCPFLALHLVLTGLPGVAVVLFAMRRGVRRAPVLLALGLIGSGAGRAARLLDLLRGWSVGESLCLLCLLWLPPLAVSALARRSGSSTILVRLAGRSALGVRLRLPALPWLSSRRHPHPLAMAKTRFSHRCPTDAEMHNLFMTGSPSTGMMVPSRSFPGNGCQATARRCRSATCCLRRPFHGDLTGSITRCSASSLQQLWDSRTLGAARRRRVRRRPASLTMVAILVSGLAIVNGFFVWPKLLSAAFLLAAAALGADAALGGGAKKVLGGCPCGRALGLALMGHGASVFGVIPPRDCRCLARPAELALDRGRRSHRDVFVGALVGVSAAGGIRPATG